MYSVQLYIISFSTFSMNKKLLWLLKKHFRIFSNPPQLKYDRVNETLYIVRYIYRKLLFEFWKLTFKRRVKTILTSTINLPEVRIAYFNFNNQLARSLRKAGKKGCWLNIESIVKPETISYNRLDKGYFERAHFEERSGGGGGRSPAGWGNLRSQARFSIVSDQFVQLPFRPLIGIKKMPLYCLASSARAGHLRLFSTFIWPKMSFFSFSVKWIWHGKVILLGVAQNKLSIILILA